MVPQMNAHVPPRPSGLVVLAPGSRAIAAALAEIEFATALVDLEVDEQDAHDIGLLARRVLDVLDRARREALLDQMPVALFGAGTGAAAVLVAAAERLEVVHAVISHDGRPELAGGALERVEAPTRLIVDPAEPWLVDLNRDAMHRMRAHVELEMAAAPRVAELTVEWCQRYLWSMA